MFCIEYAVKFINTLYPEPDLSHSAFKMPGLKKIRKLRRILKFLLHKAEMPSRRIFRYQYIYAENVMLLNWNI